MGCHSGRVWIFRAPNSRISSRESMPNSFSSISTVYNQYVLKAHSASSGRRIPGSDAMPPDTLSQSAAWLQRNLSSCSICAQPIAASMLVRR